MRRPLYGARRLVETAANWVRQHRQQYRTRSRPPGDQLKGAGSEPLDRYAATVSGIGPPTSTSIIAIRDASSRSRCLLLRESRRTGWLSGVFAWPQRSQRRRLPPSPQGRRPLAGCKAQRSRATPETACGAPACRCMISSVVSRGPPSARSTHPGGQHYCGGACPSLAGEPRTAA